MKDKRILIVDDDTMTTSILNTLFSEKGAVVTLAHTYEEGAEALKAVPDVAIVDLILAGHSGLDLVREARKSNTSTFFAILTNSVNVQDIADAMDAQILTFIQKAEHDPADIVDIIEKHFEA